MGWFSFRKRKSKGVCAIAFDQSSLSIAYQAKADQMKIDRLDWLPLDGVSWDKALLNYVEKNNMARVDCHCVLLPADYQLMPIDVPSNVSLENLSQAAAWLAKDFIDIPLRKACIDAFPMPSKKGQVSKALAVVAKQSVMIQIREKIADTGLIPVAISITELVLKDFVVKYLHQKAGLSLLFLDKKLSLIIIQDDSLAFLRTLNTPLAENVKENLLLEVQRSFDYYYTHLGQRAPDKLFLTRDIVQQAHWFVEELKKGSTAKIDELSLDQVEFSQDVPSNLSLQQLLVIAALYSKTGSSI